MAQTVPPALTGWLTTLTGTAPTTVLHPTSGAVLAFCGDVVVKVHPAGTDAADLTTQLRVAATPTLDGILVAPSRAEPVPLPPEPGDRTSTRFATLWPRLDVLTPDVTAPPWAESARTLALLHRTPLPTGVQLPPHGAPNRLRRALERLAPLEADPRAAVVLRAGRRTERDLAPTHPDTDAHPDTDTDTGPGTTGLVHGDWHLGQLGRDAAGRWLLLDLDDLGRGDPAWDLGRAAGFWAVGLLDDHSWTTFLAAYRAAGGPGVPPVGDPWPRLDVPARSEVVIAAARAVHRAHGGEEIWDEEGDALLAACTRM